jgi:anthraniloyl-CoA monooxygenase
MDRADMDRVRADFERATRLAIVAGFDMLEVHMAHGYLLGTFVSPLTNRRSDEYGGSLARRMRFPLEVFEAVRAIWPAEKPISVRISATDWQEDGLSPGESVEVAKMLVALGCDLIDVSGGGTVEDEDPIYGRMFLTPFSDRIRNEASVPTMAVGNIQGWDHVNTIIVSGRADLCALARPHLYDPYFTRHAAAEQGLPDLMAWPPQYRPARGVARRIAEELSSRPSGPEGAALSSAPEVAAREETID